MSDDIDTRLKRIREKSKRVQRLKPDGFGWKSHRYRLNPPLEEDLLIAIDSPYTNCHPRPCPATHSRP